ncbi:hypothetical protein KQI88_15870 [Alkaliphilus sp. MSJ-5]|uniref:Uncharacterized protein n=1 Tax=Alkaliphilus flagellatus TaxID=2841507 RepID=A0ABS6G918_9FIRM|nr:hypothetical protein [Alkaliphilus flagellatus]MBU5677895.1 hypothetical protein [Alkaliphilus flagellatus]
MKKRLMITTFIVLICGLTFASAASIKWSESGEWVDANSINDTMPAFLFDATGHGFDIFGVCSSVDKEDWYQIRTEVNGIFNIELDLADTNLDADVYLVRPDGTVMYPGYPSGTSKLLTNIYIPTNQNWMIKVVYKSGIPKKPYELWVGLSPASYKSYSEVINLEDVPQNLLPVK